MRKTACLIFTINKNFPFHSLYFLSSILAIFPLMMERFLFLLSCALALLSSSLTSALIVERFFNVISLPRLSSFFHF